MRSTLVIGVALSALSTAALAQTLPSANMLVQSKAQMDAPAPALDHNTVPVTRDLHPNAAAAMAPQPTVQPVNPPVYTTAPISGATVIDSTGYGAIPALPLQIMQMGDVRFINGGISDEEVEQLDSTASNYDLQIKIFGTGGEYVSDVAVRLTDAKGQVVLQVNDAGPYLYAAVKPGVYKLEASFQGQLQTFKVTVAAGKPTKKTISVNS